MAAASGHYAAGFTDLTPDVGPAHYAASSARLVGVGIGPAKSGSFGFPPRENAFQISPSGHSFIRRIFLARHD